MEAGVVIVGAGHGGDAAAAFLRQYGYAGPVTLLGEEPHAPYHRPPLSKAWLKGEAGEAELALRAADFYARQNIVFRPGALVAGIDRAGRSLRLADGETLPYCHLILATGARARPLPIPGADLPHVHALRTRADADRLRPALVPGARIVLIGGGYIGLEIAASARALGAQVTVLEREPRLLPRVASPELAAFFLARHAAEGVDLHLGATPLAITLSAVRLATGEDLAADAVLVGIGALPNVELAEQAGLACANGITTDAQGRTEDPAIFAIGDCANRAGKRLESVPNAVDMARAAAAAITGRNPPAPDTPWFWSDQYDIRLQIAGLLPGTGETIRRGGAAGFALFHLDPAGTLACVEAANQAESFAAGRAMIGRHRLPIREKLADPAVPLRDAFG